MYWKGHIMNTFIVNSTEYTLECIVKVNVWFGIVGGKASIGAISGYFFMKLDVFPNVWPFKPCKIFSFYIAQVLCLALIFFSGIVRNLCFLYFILLDCSGPILFFYFLFIYFFMIEVLLCILICILSLVLYWINFSHLAIKYRITISRVLEGGAKKLSARLTRMLSGNISWFRLK